MPCLKKYVKLYRIFIKLVNLSRFIVSAHPHSTPQEFRQLSLLLFVNPKILTSSISSPFYKNLPQQQQERLLPWPCCFHQIPSSSTNTSANSLLCCTAVCGVCSKSANGLKLKNALPKSYKYLDFKYHTQLSYSLNNQESA